MGVQDIDAQLSFTRRTGAEMKRIPLVIMLCAILTLAGSLTLTVAVSHIGSTSNVSHYPQALRSKPHVSNDYKGEETTPVTPVPTATSTARPITPFPDQLWQQMVVLQQYNRFL